MGLLRDGKLPAVEASCLYSESDMVVCMLTGLYSARTSGLSQGTSTGDTLATVISINVPPPGTSCNNPAKPTRG